MHRCCDEVKYNEKPRSKGWTCIILGWDYEVELRFDDKSEETKDYEPCMHTAQFHPYDCRYGDYRRHP